jgi:cytidylate kinase
MAIVSISRFSHTSSEAVARGVATRLGGEFVSEEVFDEAAARSDLPLEKLKKALHDAPSLLGMSLPLRRRCIAHVQAALAARFLNDNTVYLGDFGHLLVQGVSHLLKVRITAALDDRVALMAKRDECDAKAAEKAIRREDKRRRNLAQHIFGTDDDDDEPFDLVINTSQVNVETAVDIIVDTAGHKRYQPMTYSITCMQNVELGHRARAALVDLDPGVDVHAENGKLRVRIRDAGKKQRLEDVRARVLGLDGAESVEVVAVKDTLDDRAGRMG